ncbi:MAG: DUF4430 domain-containing protein [Firmicutes bacterium]|jgi:hypothetical protein|nr:DUF4430 domain-containing protein [Bacillota bacterium]
MERPLRFFLLLLLACLLLSTVGCWRAPESRPAPEPSQAAQGVSVLPPSGHKQGEKPKEPVEKMPSGQQEAVQTVETPAAAPQGNKSSGSTPQPTGAGEKAPAAVLTLWITRDFGAGVIKAVDVEPSSGQQVLDILADEVEVETTYGGGFVARINGMGGGRPGEDWFYWVNGILASIGSGEFPARPGDNIWWDFHPWNRTAFLPAVVGAYPEPFRRGYTGEPAAAQVLYTTRGQRAAELVADALEESGAPKPQLADYQEGSLLQRLAPTLLVATWPELGNDKDLNGLLKNWRKTGLYISLSDKGLAALDASGQEAISFEQGAGAIVATGSGPGDPNPLWLVLGTDDQGLEKAANLLVQQPEQLSRCIGVVVGPQGETVALPAEDKS